MPSAAFFFEIALSSIVIATTFALTTSCISCPCGSGGQNYTHCNENSLLKDFTCERWSHCQTCKANVTFCITCLPNRFGSTCLESKTSEGHTRRKRQEDPDLLNHPYYPRQSGSCPFLERPESGSVRCSQTGNERYCTSRCLPGYHFEGQENVNEITLRCRRGVWKPQNAFPPCRSGGHCEVQVTGAGFYNCTIDMNGTHCDITCDDWYRGRFHCYTGRQWKPPLPFCTVPKEPTSCRCQNGGVCDENGNCRCPEGRTGTYCENLERQRASCLDPGFPRDGSRLNPDGSDASYPREFEEGESVIYACIGESSALQGKSLITCLADGTWSSPLPRCISSGPIAYCPDPGYIQFGSRINADGSNSRPFSRYRNEQSVVYYCIDGYKLAGNSILTCLSSGKWSSSKPSCGRDDFSIRPTETPPTPETPCRHPGVDLNGRIEDHPLLDPRKRGQTFPPGTELTFDCNEGFEPEGAVILSCMRSGEWSSAPPTCKRSVSTTTERPISQGICRHPGVDVNGRIEGDSAPDPQRRRFPVGTELEFSCNDGFQPEGPTIIACRSNGQWTSLPPKCRNAAPENVRTPPEATCPVPEVNPNVEVEEFFVLDPRKVQSFEPGEKLTFSCKEGHDLEGPSVIECFGSGRWSSPPPTCNPTSPRPNTPRGGERCPPPEVDPNGEVEEFLLDPRRLTQGFDPGTELTVSCNEGYVLRGWGTIRCNNNGRWSTPSPKCNVKPPTPPTDGDPSVIRCLNPGHISNGRVSVFPPYDDSGQPPADDEDFDFPLGTHLKFMCEDGFKLLGSSDSISCEPDGYWSGSKPICAKDR